MTAATTEHAERILADYLLSLHDVWSNTQVDLMHLYMAGKVPPGNPCWQYVIGKLAGKLEQREYTPVGLQRMIRRMVRVWTKQRVLTSWPQQSQW